MYMHVSSKSTRHKKLLVSHLFIPLKQSTTMKKWTLKSHQFKCDYAKAPKINLNKRGEGEEGGEGGGG